jgi:tetratricopeptide (TPR) repeat protein
MLSQRLGRSRTTAEPAAADQILARCAHLPLALSIVAARAATEPNLPLYALAAQLRHARPLDALSTGDPATDVRAVFSWSYEALTPGAATLFRLLGLHPAADFSAAAAASLTAEPLEHTRTLLAELSRANLLVQHDTNRYTLHDLLRAYAVELCNSHDPQQQQDNATHRLLDHYLHSGFGAVQLVNPGRDPITLAPSQPDVVMDNLTDPKQAWSWFTAERSTLLACIHHAANHGFDTHTWQLTWTLVDFLDRQARWHELADTARTAASAADRLADPIAQSRAHRYAARADICLGKFTDAHDQLTAALELDHQTGDPLTLAHTHRNLANLFGRQDQHENALSHAHQALEQFRICGHERGQADALNIIGWHHGQLGSYSQALRWCQRSLAVLERLGDPYGEAHAWSSLAEAYSHLDNHRRATDCYQRSIDLFRTSGELYYEARSLSHVGNVYLVRGDHRAAETAWRRALTILTDIDHPGVAEVQNKLDQLGKPDDSHA